MEDNLPQGFRFHPSDVELITYYLGRIRMLVLLQEQLHVLILTSLNLGIYQVASLVRIQTRIY